MIRLQLYYATNRNHIGKDRWHPKGYGTKFSDDGAENLRFGRLTVESDDAKVAAALAKPRAGGTGDGEALGEYLAKCAKNAAIEAYPEQINPADDPAKAKLGSKAMFEDLKSVMEQATDVVIYIHGFNVSWTDAVGSALALQCMLNQATEGIPAQPTQVVLFSWPSDGMAIPWASYKSDRTEGAASGNAVGRGLLKMRDFLAALRDRRDPDNPIKLCGQDLHLLCHSMGNYVLQNALIRMREYTSGASLPRLFEHIFLCSSDVDDTALEPGHAMADVHELARCVTVYHNREDVALHGSDYTKGNPDRLGNNGAARPAQLHNKVHTVDCTPIITEGLMEHSYYLSGRPNLDIRCSIAGLGLGEAVRGRQRDRDLPNVWQFPAE